MKGWELALVAGACIGILAMLTTIFNEKQLVSIRKMPPAVETKYDFNGKDAPTKLSPIDPDAGAVTKWDYNCGCTMTYNVESSEQSSTHNQVCLKMTNVVVTLSLPITVHLPTDADERLKLHEEGHVQICKRIYDGAEASARSAAQSILMRQYCGSGRDREAACTEALRIASTELAERYQTETLRMANDVSEIYDFLQRKKGEPPSNSIEKAFKIYNSGQPRRLLSKSTPAF